MRKIYLSVFFICFSLTSFAVNVAKLELMPSPRLVVMDIPGLSAVRDIITTANHYAWAVSDNSSTNITKVAFYDGTRWNAPESMGSPSGDSVDSILFPVYPMTGKLPTAWLLRFGSDPLLFYFNASMHWSTMPVSAKNLLELNSTDKVKSLQLFSKEGVVYIVAEVSAHETNLIKYAICKDGATWSKVQKISDATLGLRAPNIHISSNGDNQNLALLLHRANGQASFEMASITPDGVITLAPVLILTKDNLITNFFSSEGRTYITYRLSKLSISSSLLFKTSANPSWQKTGEWEAALPCEDCSDYTDFGNLDVENNGVYSSLFQSIDEEKKGFLSLNTNSKQPELIKIFPIGSIPDFYARDASTRSDGAWISGVSASSYKFTIYDYDAVNNKLYDTNIQQISRLPTDDTDGLLIAALGQHQLLAMNTANVGERTPLINLYDNSKKNLGWQPIDAQGFLAEDNTTYSTQGNPQSGTTRIDDPMKTDLWFYNDYYEY